MGPEAVATVTSFSWFLTVVKTEFGLVQCLAAANELGFYTVSGDTRACGRLDVVDAISWR
jgi:hypothetical protein